MLHLDTHHWKPVRPTDNDVVDPLEASFLESHRLDIAAFCEHGDHIVEPDVPFEPIRIAYAWLSVFRLQFIILSPTPLETQIKR